VDVKVAEADKDVSDEAIAAYAAFTDALSVPGKGHAAAHSRFFSPSALINVVHPFGFIQGVDAYVEQVLTPLQRAFETLHRRDQIIISGRFRGEEWVSATGYLVGNFVRDWLGIRSDGELTFLRFGEFHRMEMGRAVESYIYLDLSELMISRGQWPVDGGPGLLRGYTGPVPGPATNDGILRRSPSRAGSETSMRMVGDMIHNYGTWDEAWRKYWKPDMSWYGPAAFGSFLGLDGFASFQIPFEAAFENLVGGIDGQGHASHFARFGCGDYACVAGWPSLSGVHVAPLLDMPPSFRRLYLRSANWWRRDKNLLAENWVMVDVPDLLLQMGYDVLRDVSGSDSARTKAAPRANGIRPW
jgi:hypothetical protein